MVISVLLFFYPLITALSLFFTRLSHPLAMGLALLSQTILICVITGLSNSSFWFSYILFLIFLGGMLVLFIYVTSLASNEMFTPSITMAFVFTTVLLLSAGLLFIDPMIIPKTPLYDFGLPLKNLAYSSDLSLISTIYNPTVMNLTIFIVFYLLLTLIVVVKITDAFFGPLRLSFN